MFGARPWPTNWHSALAGNHGLERRPIAVSECVKSAILTEYYLVCGNFASFCETHRPLGLVAVFVFVVG